LRRCSGAARSDERGRGWPRDELACACLVLAAQADGAIVETVAGMTATGGELHPLAG